MPTLKNLEHRTIEQWRLLALPPLLAQHERQDIGR